MASQPLIKVRSNAELLESMLFQLEPPDLLCAQRVSRWWKDVITGSPTLQQKLFFRPVSDPNHKPEVNPMLKALFPPFFQPNLTPEPANFWETVDIHDEEWYWDSNYRAKVLRPDASWRKMFPVQPPANITTIVALDLSNLFKGFKGHGKIGSEFGHLEENGAPMGLIYDVLVHLSDNVAWGRVWIHWHMLPAVSGGCNDKESVLLYLGSCTAASCDTSSTNRIPIYISHCGEAMGSLSAPSGLKIADIHPKLVQYCYEGSHEQISKGD